MDAGWTQTSGDGRLHSPPLSAVGPHLDTVPVHVRGCARVRRRALLEHTRVSISTRPDPRFDASTSTRGHPGKCCDAVGLFSSALFVKSAEINLVATIAGGQDCQRLDIAMSAAVNPGVKDTPVNLDTLLKAVGCPICGEMFTHPVTVVRPRPAIREFPGALNSPRAPNVPRLTPVPPARYPTTDGVPALVLPRVYRQDRAARPGNDQRVPHVRHQAREQPVRGEKSRQRSSQGEHRGQAEGVRGVGGEWGCGGGGSDRTAGGGGARTRGSSSGGSRTGGCRAGTRGARAGTRGC